MNQTDLKYVIGYSSVSHMGYVILGIAMANRFGLEGAVFQMFAHGIMTALFFALIGYVYESSHTRQIAEISRPHAPDSLGRRRLRHRVRLQHGPAFHERIRRRAARLHRRHRRTADARRHRLRRRRRSPPHTWSACSAASCSASPPRRSADIEDARPVRVAPMIMSGDDDHGRRHLPGLHVPDHPKRRRAPAREAGRGLADGHHDASSPCCSPRSSSR